MTGVPAHLIGGTDFIMLHLDLVDACGGSWEAAGLLARIDYRSGGDGWWTTTRDEMAQDTRLTESKLKRAINELIERGFIESERSSSWDPTRRWRVIKDDQKPPARDGENLPHEREKSPVTSTKNSKNKTNPPTPPIATADAADDTTPEPTPYQPDPLAVEAADLLADLIAANGSKRPTITKTWITELERMHRIDLRSWADIMAAIRWSQTDPFWRANVLSPKKLRDKFDQMRLQAQRPKTSNVRVNAHAQQLAAQARGLDPLDPDSVAHLDQDAQTLLDLMPLRSIKS